MQLFVFICISIIFLFSPFLRGLYFDEDFYGIQIIIIGSFFLLLLYLLLRKERLRITYPLIIVILPILLLISYFYSVTPLGAMNEVLRWTTYSCFFLLAIYVAQEEKYKRYFFYLIQLTGLIISIFSLAGYNGLIEAEGMIVAGQLGGVFQYPNTYAAIMGGLALCSISMLIEHKGEKKENLLIAIPIIPAILGVLLSGSSGVFVFSFIVWMIGLFFYRSKKQLDYFLITFLSVGFSLILFLLSGNKSPLIWFFLGLAIVLFVNVDSYLKNISGHDKQPKVFRKLYNVHPLFLPVFMIVLFFLALIDVLFKGLVYSIIPLSIRERILSINLDTFYERLTIAKDALKASLDSILLGYGGDSWSVLFTKYQTLPYQTNNLHNGYLEWLLNTGIIGFIGFIGMVICFLIKLIKNDGKGLQNRGILLFLLLVFLHSLIDFNMSYGTVWFYIFIMLAIGLPKQNFNERGETKLTRPFKLYKISALIVIICLSGFTVFQSSRLMMSSYYFNKVVEETSLQYKIYYVNQSIKYNSHDIDKWNTLGLLLLENKNTSKEIIKSIAEKIIQEEPNRSKGYTYAVNLLEHAGLLIEANKLVDQGLAIDYFNPSMHEQSLKLKMNLAISYIQSKNIADANQIANEAIEQYKQLQREERVLLKRLPGENFNSRSFSITEEIDYYYALILFIKEDYNKVMEVANTLIKTENNELKMRIEALLFVVDAIRNGKKIEQIESNGKQVNEYIKQFKRIYQSGH